MKQSVWFAVGAAILIGIVGLIASIRMLTGQPLPFQTAGQQTSGPRSTTDFRIDIAVDDLYQIRVSDLPGTELQNWDDQPVALSQNGQPVPFFLNGDQLLFYGEGSSSIYAAQNSYILQTGPEVEAVQMSTASLPPAVENRTLDFAWQTIRLEEDHRYVSTAYTPEFVDTWYWHTIHVEQSFTVDLSLPAIKPTEPATITLHLYGASGDIRVADDHDLDLVINGQTIETIRWDGENHILATISIPAGVLRSGTNSILLDNSVPGAVVVDIMQLDWIELTVPAVPDAHAGRMEFTASEGQISVSGFSESPLVLDISNKQAPVQLAYSDYAADNLRLSTTNQQKLMLIEPTAAARPTGIIGLRESLLTETSNQADLIIITTDELKEAVNPLVEAREAEGLTVSIATVDEIYDQFGHGQRSPTSIQAFLRFTAEQWQDPAPAYVLLVGDGSYDYRNILETRPDNYVPSIMVPVEHSGETVSDARLADIDGDMKPDMAVGRWPVSDRQTVASIAARTVAYENAPVSDQALFTADGSSPEFTSLSDRLIEATVARPEEALSKLYGASFDEVTTQWNQGAWLVTYVGHGSLNLWGKDNLLSIDAVPLLAPIGDIAPPIVLQMTCLTGLFSHPTENSISEQMLIHDAGPVLLIAATSLTLSVHQEPFARDILDNLQNPEMMRMGDVLQAAKQELDVSGNKGLREISDTFGLIGDPSAKINRPATASLSSN